MKPRYVSSIEGPMLLSFCLNGEVSERRSRMAGLMTDYDETDPGDALQRIAGFLAELEAPGSFAVRGRMPMEALSLEVRGVGPLRLPVSGKTARALQSVSRPARHGYREQTLLDTSVRDTWEVAKSRIKLDRRQWNAALRPELERIRCALGFPEEYKLKAELHNLLLYSKGQFFRTHQDSEKCDDMVGTLVVTLPSKVKGGQLVVRHHDEEKRFRSSSDSLALVAFYADCHHEVLPVIDGFRVALTFNLVASRYQPIETTKPSGPRLDALVTASKAYFETQSGKWWRRDEPDSRPDRMVYLLDHEYTQRALGWNSLKNRDAVRAVWLREVAEKLECEIMLTQAEVHETWQCEDESRRGRYRSRWDDYDDDEDDDDDNHEDIPELIDIIDTSIGLSHFVDIHGKTTTGSIHVTTDEVCFTKPSMALDPFKSEHEGFMGNWGNTVDRWYRRAAITLWPRTKSFMVKAKASAHWAVGEIGQTIKAGRIEAARGMVRELAPFWELTARNDIKAKLVGAVLRVASALNDRELAKDLLKPFLAHDIAPSLARPLVRLASTFGSSWFKTIIDETTSGRICRYETEHLKWLETLPTLVAKLQDMDPALGHDIATCILTPHAAWLTQYCRSHARPCLGPSANDMKGIEASILGVTESAVLLEDNVTHLRIMELLKSHWMTPVALSHLLRTSRRSYSRAALSKLKLGPAVSYCINELEMRLQKPPRSASDWSLDSQSTCGCTACKTFANFLRAPDRRRFEWPLKKDLRRHIHNIISVHELPIDHTTRRTGRPFTLLLVKTPALFQQAAAQRSAWKENLSWLKRHEKAFAPPPTQTSAPMRN